MFRVLAIIGVMGLASCTGDSPAVLSPAPSAAPATDTTGIDTTGIDTTGIDTPNTLPDSYTNHNPMNDDTGVVGVRHLPP